MSKPNVVLINFSNPSIPEIRNNDVQREGLGIIIVNELLKKQKISTHLLSVPEEVNKNNIKLDDSFYGRFIEIIKSKNPTHIGFTTFADNYVNIIVLAKKIKEEIENVKIFLGGQQATNTAHETMKKFDFIDFLIIGEFENIAEEFSNYLKKEISIEELPNAVYKKSGEIKSNTVLRTSSDEIPQINYSKNNIKNTYPMHIESGRGCPFNCTFCTSGFWGDYRPKPIDKFIEEIRINKEKGIKKFEIADLHFTIDKKRLQKFCEKIRTLDIQWKCQGHINSLDEKTILEMEDSGCKQISFGIESGDKNIRDRIKKNIDLEKAEKIIKFIGNETDITPKVSFITGFPFENKETLKNTFIKATKYYLQGSDIVLMPLFPLPCTELLRKYNERLVFDSKIYKNSDLFTILNEDKESDLIKQNKNLFVAYYRYEPLEVSRYYILAVTNIFAKYLENFPLTLNYIIKSSETNLIKHLDEIIFQFSDNTHKAFFETLENSNINRMIEKTLKHHGNKKVRSMFENELNNKISFETGKVERYV